MSKPDGGPAFSGPATTPHGTQHHNPGMSLRDYFAGQAANGCCANKDFTVFEKLMEDPKDFAERVASSAYEIADAMIAERNKEES